MPGTTSLIELDERIAAARDNLAALTEQATAYSGAADEERNSERIREQQELLDDLLRKRAVLTGE